MKFSWGPDITVCVKFLTHAFTAKCWIRINSGLENRVIRLSHSDPRGPDHPGYDDSFPSGLDYSLFLLEDLSPFFSFICLSGWRFKVPPLWGVSKMFRFTSLRPFSREVKLKSASLPKESTACFPTSRHTLLGGCCDLCLPGCLPPHRNKSFSQYLLQLQSHGPISDTFHIHSILQTSLSS